MSAEPKSAEERVRDWMETRGAPRSSTGAFMVFLMHAARLAEEHEEHAAAAVAQLTRERDEARKFGERAAAEYNSLLAVGQVLRCAFCEAEYPRGTPPTQHEALAAHIEVCPKHPMRKAERERDEARAENAGLRALLERCEWSECSLRGSIAHDAAMDLCPICGGADPEMVDEESAVAALPCGNAHYDERAIAKLLTKRDHRPDCALAKAIGREGA